MIKYFLLHNDLFSARAPELAKLYLVDKIKGCPEQWGSLLDLIFKYCQKFGGKSSTYFDLEPYLNLLDEEKASSLIESLLNGDPDEKCADSACCSHILPYLFKVAFSAVRPAFRSENVRFSAKASNCRMLTLNFVSVLFQSNEPFRC